MAATKRKDPETKDPPARKRRKTLQSIVEMPIDILYEIFSHLHPNDLLRLSWATKALREILMSRTSASVWKASREEIGFDDSMIPTFCDLNEPTLAKMLFCPICTHCGTVKATQITWNAFSRVCKDCSYANFATPYVMREIKKIPIHPQFPTELWDTLPYTLNDAIGSVDFPVKQYRISAATLISQDLFQLVTDEERKNFIEGKKEEAKVNAERIKACQAWAESRGIVRVRTKGQRGRGRGRR